MNVVLTPGLLPNDFCHSTWQTTYEALVAATTANLPGTFNGINFGPTTPAAIDRDKPWFRVNADGTPDRWYVYSGQWLSPHPVPALSKQVIIWDDTEANLWLYDGGDGLDPSSNPPTATTGAMWVRNTNFDFKMPLGIGTSPVAYDSNPATVVVPGDTGGEQRHTLTGPESGIAAHTHPISLYNSVAGVVNVANVALSNGAGKLASDATGPTSAAQSHENMPPYRGVIFAKRSARVYLTL